MTNTNYEDIIGKNISKERKAKGWSQRKLGQECDIANTVISAYEQTKKTPGLNSVVKISNAIGISLDQLVYGDESIALINSARSTGRKIVNCIHALWELDLLSYVEKRGTNGVFSTPDKERAGAYLYIHKYSSQIERLLKNLNEFKEKKNTYSDPDSYLESILSSVAKEIDDIIASQNQPIIKSSNRKNK